MPALDVHAPFRLDGRIAIVTGASSGLGERFARVLHAAGATVVLGARRRDRIEALAADLGDRALPVPGDVAVDADCERLVSTALDASGGRIDVVVNNAGTTIVVPAESEPIEEFRRVVDINLTGLFLISQLAGRAMLEAGSGTIVNVASMLGQVAAAPIREASYCASKGAVINLTRELACQWARRGVRVNALAPGWFPTEMTEDMWGDAASEAYVARNCPMGRPGAETELDGALLFLASDASSYVTGQVLTVDGGWTAR